MHALAELFDWDGGPGLLLTLLAIAYVILALIRTWLVCHPRGFAASPLQSLGRCLVREPQRLPCDSLPSRLIDHWHDPHGESQPAS